MIHEGQIILNRGDYTTCSINVIGGTVTSWKIQHNEQLFVSRENQYAGLSKIRGGCNIAFPHFSMWNMGPPYGFTRDVAWSLEDGPETLKNGDVWALMSCSSDPYTNSMYSYLFKVMFKITLCEYKLIFNIYVENLSPYIPMEYQIVHQVLFKVPDVAKCEIVGFHKCQFLNHQRRNNIESEDREILSISEVIDRLYTDVPSESTITNMMAGDTMRVTRKGMDDVNVWNPWQQKGIRNLGDDEFQYFIALEAGRVMTPIKMEPLSCWQARHIFEIIPKRKRKDKTVNDFYDLFNDLC